MTPKPIDFSKVEALRRHMLMTHVHMAQVLGVSRMTYHNWLRGKPMSKQRHEYVKATIRKLIGIMNEHGWPSDEVTQLSSDDRHARLLALIGGH